METHKVVEYGNDLEAARAIAWRAEARARQLAELLERTRAKVGATASQIHSLEADRDAWRRKYRRAVREYDRERALHRRLLTSRAYRVARALGDLKRDPTGTAPRLVRAVLRRLLAGLRTARGQNGEVDGKPAPLSVAAMSTTAYQAPGNTRSNRIPVLSEELKVYAYVALGFDLEGLRAIVLTMLRCALISGNHVPLVVTDAPSFSLLRDTGVAMEYIPNREVWELHRPDLSWDRFLSDRLSNLVMIHQPARLILLSPSTPFDLWQVLALSAGA